MSFVVDHLSACRVKRRKKGKEEGKASAVFFPFRAGARPRGEGEGNVSRGNPGGRGGGSGDGGEWREAGKDRGEHSIFYTIDPSVRDNKLKRGKKKKRESKCGSSSTHLK